MAAPRFLAAAATLAFLAPASLPAQETSSMLARVQAEGDPVAGVPFTVLTDGNRRRVATTGSSGLAVVEFDRAPLSAGTRLVAFAVLCEETAEIVLVGSAATPPMVREGCRRDRLGVVVWNRTERLDVALGDPATMTVRTASEVLEARTGFRAQLGPVLAFVTGEELGNIGSGLGGELVAGFDGAGGLGLGAAVSLVRHSLEGVDENMWRLGIAAEPRYTFHRPEWSARPYVVARVGWQRLDSEEGSGLATETGWSFGGGAGVSVPLALGLSADVAAHLARLSVSAQGQGRAGFLFDVGAAIRF